MWLKSLAELRDNIRRITCQEYDSVLVNYYRDGNDHISLHHDKHKYVSYKSTIASVSFGASRQFLLKCTDTNKNLFVMLHHRDLLLLKGDANEHYMHGIKKDPKILNPRYNLTFRLNPRLNQIKRKASHPVPNQPQTKKPKLNSSPQNNKAPMQT